MTDGPRPRFDFARRVKRSANQSARQGPRTLRAMALVTSGPALRERRDPRLARATEIGPNGRSRRVRGALNPLPQAPVEAQAHAEPFRNVSSPKVLALACVAARDGVLSRFDREALGMAHEWALHHDGAVVALTPRVCTDFARAGADRLAILPEIDHNPNALAEIAATLILSGQVHLAVFPHTTAGRHAARLCACLISAESVIGAHKWGAQGITRRAFAEKMDATTTRARVVTPAPNQAPTQFAFRFAASPHSFVNLPHLSQIGCEQPIAVASGDAHAIVLEEARLILCAGAGVQDWSGFASLCRQLNAAPAGTRIVCDQGRLPRDRQIGASGHAANADLYIALGVSGAQQHLQGLERCQRVVAVNIDPYAPIFRRADTGIVADADAVMRSLSKLVGSAI